MGFSDAPALLQQAEKILLRRIHPHLIACCPTMDLIAVVTDEENLDVYRINGQRAFGLRRKNDDVAVDMIKWEFNGKSIAVSWSDGRMDLVSAETGKVALKDLELPKDTEKDGESGRVRCIGWGLNFIDVEAVKSRTRKATRGFDLETEEWDDTKDDADIDDFLQRQPDLQALDCAPDLPDQLAVMDVETLLPKLPAIPLPPTLPFMRLSQADSGAFSSQAEVDALLHSQHLKDYNSVDMFIRCSERGTVHPSIYDSLETVTVGLSPAWNIESTPLLHISHPYACSHGLLMRTTSSDSQAKHITFVPLTLNFIPNAGIYLHLIASKTSQLQNLLLYITQCLQRIRTFFKQATDLPSKFMMNITETLEEKGQGDLITNLFHLACTGACPPLIREWLVDELTEQGHKRWDSTVTNSLTTLQALIHENLIPALDRTATVISRLRGLAMFHDSDWIFSRPATQFNTLLDVLQNMRLLAHTALSHVGDEKRQFHAFSRWLRFVIDFEATEPNSQSRAEMEGRDSGVDIGLVLDYVRHGLQQSSLKPYLMPEIVLDEKYKQKEGASYEDTKKAIAVAEEGQRWRPDALCLEHVLGHLTKGTTDLLRQVSKWQESGTQMNSGIVLSPSSSDGNDTVDMRMIYEVRPTALPSTLPANKAAQQPSTMSSSSSTVLSTYVAISAAESKTLTIHRLTHASAITSLPRDLYSHGIASLSFPGTITSFSFSDDSSLLVLLHPPESSSSSVPESEDIAGHRILRIPYASPDAVSASADSSESITYTMLPAATASKHLLPTGAPPASVQETAIQAEQVHNYTIHVFAQGERFVPHKLVVNGRKGRRVVVVLAEDGKHYRVLDLDYPGRGYGHEEGDEGAEGKGGEEEEEEDTVMSGL